MLRKFKTLLIGTALSITLIGVADAKWPRWEGQDVVKQILEEGWTQDADGQDYDLVQKTFSPEEREAVAQLEGKEYGVALSPKKHLLSRPTQCKYSLIFSFNDDKGATQTLTIGVDIQRRKHIDAGDGSKKAADISNAQSEADQILPSLEASSIFSMIIPVIEKIGSELIALITGKSNDPVSDPASDPSSDPASDGSSVLDGILTLIKPLLPMIESAIEAHGPEIFNALVGEISKLLKIDLPSLPVPVSNPVVPGSDPAVVPGSNASDQSEDHDKKPHDKKPHDKKPRKDKK